MTRPLSELQRRHAGVLAGDCALWREWERAFAGWVACSQRLERSRAMWERRLAKAMRGVVPETWWRYHRRLEAGELWVGPSAGARRAQALVQVTRSTVLDLAARREDDVRSRISARGAAAEDLRAATVGVVTVLGVPRVATMLGVPLKVVRTLYSGEEPTVQFDALPAITDPGLTARDAVLGASTPRHRQLSPDE